MKVLVTGGTGFVGSSIVRELRAREIEVRALARDAHKAQRLADWGAEPVIADITDAEAVVRAAERCTHVIHLVAVIRGRASEFERVMVGGTRNVLNAASAAGVQRFLHMSALGVNEQTRALTPYFAAKWQMEQDVSASPLEHVIFRPTFVFGANDGVLPTFVRQVRYSPVVTVIGNGKRRLQPIWVEDVAAHFVKALDLPAAAGGAFDLGGPDTVTWDELYRRIARTMHKRRAFVHVPAGIARPGARLTEWIPRSPLTADQVAMLEAGDYVVGSSATVDTFGLPLVPLGEQLRRAVP